IDGVRINSPFVVISIETSTSSVDKSRPMQIVKTQLLGLCLLALLGFNRVAGAATLFPHRTLGWNKIPNITVLGQEGDSKNKLIGDGVDFWNQQLAEIGSGFKLGPIRFVSQILPPAELAAMSQSMLDGQKNTGAAFGLHAN